MTKTLAVQLGRYGITVNCIHPGTTRTERTPSLLAARAAQVGVSSEEAERRDFAPDSPRDNLVVARSHWFPDNLVALLGAVRAWHCSTENA